MCSWVASRSGPYLKWGFSLWRQQRWSPVELLEFPDNAPKVPSRPLEWHINFPKLPYNRDRKWAQTFWHRLEHPEVQDIPAKFRDIPSSLPQNPRKTNFRGMERTFRPPALHMKDTHPTRQSPDPKSAVQGPSSSSCDLGNGKGGGSMYLAIWGGGKRTVECALQIHFWRPLQVGLVWSVPVSCKENDRAWTNGRGKRIGGGGPKPSLGRGHSLMWPAELRSRFLVV